MSSYQETAKALLRSSFLSSHLQKPVYDSLSFSRIPATIFYLLTGKDKEFALPESCYYPKEVEGVIVLFLDALGWTFFEQFCDHPFLQRFLQGGIATPISSQFPSTTAAHVTTMHTGLEVGQTGIYEWYQYEPLVDKMISPLLFSLAGDCVENSLLSSQHPPRAFFPFPSFYEKLHHQGVESYVLQEANLSRSPYSQALCQGAHRLSYLHLAQGVQTLRELFMTPKQKKIYAFLYYGNIDAMGHRKGVRSSHFARAIRHCLDILERELMPYLSRKVALLVTADHGMVPVHPKKVLYVNILCPELETLVQRNARGEKLIPAGSCRDFFLHIEERYLVQAQIQLQRALSGRAEVWQVKDLMQRGFFGSQPVSERFLQRVGNLVILPYLGEAVWWYYPHKFEQNFYGAHGGLSREELETIFLFS
ncbi:MAG: alkaline phosphatase family protein [Chlamydiae bacterium]|nr:alkaline phosphatase family protein [Chlamydiota bacterium]